MALLVSAVVLRARTLVNDTTGVRWTDPEMLLWINDGRREMATARPSIFGHGSKLTHALSAGAYQELDASTGAYAVADIAHNLVGGQPGPVISLVTKSSLDSFRPGWLQETGNSVQNWVVDPSNPLGFWVYPAVTGGQVAVTAMVTPAELYAMDDVALPFDQYLTTLVNYVLYRAYSKDAEAGANAQIAAAYLQLFSAAFAA